jgi:hypothetical protein
MVYSPFFWANQPPESKHPRGGNGSKEEPGQEAHLITRIVYAPFFWSNQPPESKHPRGGNGSKEEPGQEAHLITRIVYT